MEQLCSRCYKLHFNPRLGLHTHIPILFDYFHLSAITTTIHGSLLCLIPPYVFDRYREKNKVFADFYLKNF
jgi:signal-transduction protein with cAMP-binding, CBS, and nucleotidyltransferase domain